MIRLFFLTAVVGALFLFSTPTPTLALEMGASAPDFELKSLDGRTVRLSDYRGQIILLKLATTWCPACKQQSQEIRDAGNYLKKHNVMVVEVFLGDPERLVREFLKGEKYVMPFAALLDKGTVERAYNVFVIPKMVLIDPDLKVRSEGGLMPSREIIKQVEKIVTEFQLNQTCPPPQADTLAAPKGQN